jgi:hypothetical protein
MLWSFDIDTLSAVLQQLDARAVSQAACVSRLWSLTTRAEPAVEMNMKALKAEAKRTQWNATEAIESLHSKPGHYGFSFTTGLPFKQGGDLAALQTEKRQAEALEIHIAAWLSKRRRISCVREINASFLIELS